MKIQPLLVALATTGLLASGHAKAAGQAESMPDDGAVLAAILDHTVAPEIKKASSRAQGAPLAILRTRSTPLCRNRPAGQTTCRIPEEWSPRDQDRVAVGCLADGASGAAPQVGLIGLLIGLVAWGVYVLRRTLRNRGA